MFSGKTILPITLFMLLLWPGIGRADVLQLKCSGTNAAVRYAKARIDGRIYFADKYGRIAVPSIAALASKRITVYALGNRGALVRVPRSGVLFVPCQ